MLINRMLTCLKKLADESEEGAYLFLMAPIERILVMKMRLNFGALVVQ
jgi:hypothetical protein